jgi:hypothetical protein
MKAFYDRSLLRLAITNLPLSAIVYAFIGYLIYERLQ